MFAQHTIVTASTYNDHSYYTLGKAKDCAYLLELLEKNTIFAVAVVDPVRFCEATEGHRDVLREIQTVVPEDRLDVLHQNGFSVLYLVVPTEVTPADLAMLRAAGNATLNGTLPRCPGSETSDHMRFLER